MDRITLLALALLPLSAACTQNVAEAETQEDSVELTYSDAGTKEPGEATEETVSFTHSFGTGSYGGGFGGSYGFSSDSEEFDEDAARAEAEEELGSEGYDYSYGCTVDCSGHEAGWGYQAEEGYGSYPSGKSRSFEEGRMAYDEAVDERVEEMRSDWESEQSDY